MTPANVLHLRLHFDLAKCSCGLICLWLLAIIWRHRIWCRHIVAALCCGILLRHNCWLCQEHVKQTTSNIWFCFCIINQIHQPFDGQTFAASFRNIFLRHQLEVYLCWLDKACPRSDQNVDAFSHFPHCCALCWWAVLFDILSAQDCASTSASTSTSSSASLPLPIYLYLLPLHIYIPHF